MLYLGEFVINGYLISYILYLTHLLYQQIVLYFIFVNKVSQIAILRYFMQHCYHLIFINSGHLSQR